MKTKAWAILTVLFTTILTSTAQIMYKIGADRLEFTILGLITNYHLLIGLSLYAVGAGAVIIAFRGGEVSVLYPIIATSYIWVSFLSMVFLGEMMNLFKWVGILSIVAGIILIGYGSQQDSGLEYPEAM